jgi:hypothetical protein
MGSGLLRILEITWKFAKPFDRLIGITLVALTALAVFLVIKHDSIISGYGAIFWAAGIILYFTAIVPPVKRMVDRHHEYVFHVALWGIASLLLVLFAFYAIYFIVVDDQTHWERILNLPPVFAAVFGAAIGWYVHQQLSAKNHRTNNSFNLVIQTRTSAEFLKQTRNLYSAYPPTGFNSNDTDYFDTMKRVAVYQKGRNLEAKEKPTEDEKLAHLNELSKMDAVEGLMYLLNFYEFMAFGIQAGDLDENLLYETLSPSVVVWYSRARPFIDFLHSKNDNKLAYQHLDKLVEGYSRKVGDKDEVVDGWRKRLEIEKANLSPR